MSAPLDIDQLHTFIAIVDTGSFTKAAERVFKTQSAVSMQMRRLEERIGKQLFAKDGRGKWFQKQTVGDSFFRLTGRWHRMSRLIDRRANRYIEHIGR